MKNDLSFFITNFLPEERKPFLSLLDKIHTSNNFKEFSVFLYNLNGFTKERKTWEIVKKCLPFGTSDEEVFGFLAHVFVLLVDLRNDPCLNLDLLLKNVGTIYKDPNMFWHVIIEAVRTTKSKGGTLRLDTPPLSLSSLEKKAPVIIRQEQDTEQPVLPVYGGDVGEKRILKILVLLGSLDTSDRYRDVSELALVLGTSSDMLLHHLADMENSEEILQVQDTQVVVHGQDNIIEQFCSKFTEQDLLDFQTIVWDVFGEEDPKYDLPQEQRYMSSFLTDKQIFSSSLKLTCAKGFAFICHNLSKVTSWTNRDIQFYVANTLNPLFDKMTWKRLATISFYLPYLAQADELAYLQCVSTLSPSLLQEFYGQEGNFYSGGFFTNGLGESLQVIARGKANFLTSIMEMARLVPFAPKNNNGDTVFEMIVSTLLPWMPQTLAPSKQRKVAVKKMVAECPDTGWNVLLRLLPHATSTTSQRDAYLLPFNQSLKIPEVDNETYKDEEMAYAKLAVDNATTKERRDSLLQHYKHLYPKDRLLFLSMLHDAIISDPESEADTWNWLFRQQDEKRLPLEDKKQIETILQETKHLMGIEQYKEVFSWQYHRKDKDALLHEQAETTSLLYRIYGIDALLSFGMTVKNPTRLGCCLSGVPYKETKEVMITKMLGLANCTQRTTLLSAYLNASIEKKGLGWFASLDNQGLSQEQRLFILELVNFQKDLESTITKWLGDDMLYWKHCPIPYYTVDNSFVYCMEKLLLAKRSASALKICDEIITSDQPPFPPPELVGSILSTAPDRTVEDFLFDPREVVNALLYLEKSPFDKATLLKLECSFIGCYVMDMDDERKPKTFIEEIKKEPVFFMDLMKVSYAREHRTESEKQQAKPISEQQRKLATDLYGFFEECHFVPGLDDQGHFDEQHFLKWISDVQALARECDRLSLTNETIGKMLYASPPDPDGFWMLHPIAKVLDNNASMIIGYSITITNSRGVHYIDPTGKDEDDLGDKYQHMADEAADVGYANLSTMMREEETKHHQEAEHLRANGLRTEATK